MTDFLKPLRRRALLTWSCWLLSMGLLWGQIQFSVLHPYARTFALRVLITFAGSLATLLRGVVRIARGPTRSRALA
jgi:hypothetical protein